MNTKIFLMAVTVIAAFGIVAAAAVVGPSTITSPALAQKIGRNMTGETQMARNMTGGNATMARNMTGETQMARNMTGGNATIATADNVCLPPTEDLKKTPPTDSGFKPSSLFSSSLAQSTLLPSNLPSEAKIVPIQTAPAWRPTAGDLPALLCPEGISPNTPIIRGFPLGLTLGGPLPPNKGLIVVEKIIAGPGPATITTPQEFRIDVKGPSGSFLNPPAPGAGVYVVDPGHYSVFETIAPGYIPIGYRSLIFSDRTGMPVAGTSGDCRNVFVNAGELLFCYVWNKPIPPLRGIAVCVTGTPPQGRPCGTISIDKIIVDDSGGTATISDFNIRLTVSGNTVRLDPPYVERLSPYAVRYLFTFGGTATTTTVPYRVTENSISGYLPPTFPLDSASGTVAPSQTKNIRIINNDRYR